MTFVRKATDGRYYICNRKAKRFKRYGAVKKGKVGLIFLVKQTSGGVGYVVFNKRPLCMPKELVGKRVYIELKVVED